MLDKSSTVTKFGNNHTLRRQKGFSVAVNIDPKSGSEAVVAQAVAKVLHEAVTAGEKVGVLRSSRVYLLSIEHVYCPAIAYLDAKDLFYDAPLSLADPRLLLGRWKSFRTIDRSVPVLPSRSVTRGGHQSGLQCTRHKQGCDTSTPVRLLAIKVKCLLVLF